MNTEEMLILHTGLIKKYAQVAMIKVKKPTEYTLDDLFQEGALVFLRTEKTYVKSRGASFKTFLTLCLRNHFASLVKRTYRKQIPSWITALDRSTFSEEMDFITKKKALDTFEVVQMLFLIDSFSSDELKYVNTIMSFIYIPKRYRRKTTREALGISYDREKELRRSLKDKIKK